MANIYEKRSKGFEFGIPFFNIDFHIMMPRELVNFFEFCFVLGTVMGTQVRWKRGKSRRLRVCIVLFGFGFHVEIA